jgi:hypothetical protein
MVGLWTLQDAKSEEGGCNAKGPKVRVLTGNFSVLRFVCLDRRKLTLEAASVIVRVQLEGSTTSAPNDRAGHDNLVHHALIGCKVHTADPPWRIVSGHLTGVGGKQDVHFMHRVTSSPLSSTLRSCTHGSAAAAARHGHPRCDCIARAMSPASVCITRDRCNYTLMHAVHMAGLDTQGTSRRASAARQSRARQSTSGTSCVCSQDPRS